MDGSRRCHEEVLPAFSPPAFPRQLDAWRHLLDKLARVASRAHTSEGEPKGDAVMDGSRRCH